MQQAEVMVEALVAWKKGFVKPEMPFSDAGGLVAIGLEQFSDCQLIRMDTGW